MKTQLCQIKNKMLTINKGQVVERDKVLGKLVDMLYDRNDFDLKRGCFRVRGDILEIIPSYQRKEGFACRKNRLGKINCLLYCH